MRVLLLLCLALPALCDKFDQRIVDGSNANIADYPHQLSLRVTGSHSCGASLIGNTRAVTAAHCGGSAIGVYTILGGTTDRTDTSCSTCTLRDLNLFSRHPDYVESGALGYPNDIAVLGFAAVSFNGNLQAITLSTPSDGNYAGDQCTITGWGRISGGGAIPVTLQQASMTVMTNSACGGVWGAGSVNDGHICITDATSASCSGDSGGPLECSNRLAGATSWGHANCLPSYPSVYSRISFFYAWIIIQ